MKRKKVTANENDGKTCSRLLAGIGSALWDDSAGSLGGNDHDPDRREYHGRYLNEGECYVLGHSYTFNIYMTVNNPAYYKFATNLTVSVNGQSETITKSRDLYNCHYTYSFGACEEAPASIFRAEKRRYDPV